MKTTSVARSKYRAKRTIIDGIAFPSLLEATVYIELKRQEKQGLIEIRQLQPQVVMRSFFGDDPQRCRLTRYKPDFLIVRDGVMIFVEAKGVETPKFRHDKATWKKSGPARLEIWKGAYRNGNCYVKCAEVIDPPGT